MTTHYEHGKDEVLRQALEPIIREYEDRLRILKAAFYQLKDEPIEKALSRIAPCDREYYYEVESWLRDFKKMLATLETT